MIPFVLAAGLLTSLVLGDRTETRLRVMEGPYFGVDLATVPSARIDLRDRRTRFSFGYSPSLTLGDLETGFNFQLFHMADASLLFVARRTFIAVATSDSYGDFNFGYLLPTSVPTGSNIPPPQIVPTTAGEATTIRYGSTHTAISFSQRWRRVAFTLSAEHGVGGGMDAPSRLVVPIISTPSASASFAWDATRRDQLTTDLKATAASSTPRPCDPTTGGPLPDPLALYPQCAPNQEWAELRETWRHSLARHSTLTLAAGGAAVRAQINPQTGPPDTPTYTPMPTGEITLLHDFGVGRPWHSVLQLGARVSPIVDIRYSIVESRVDTNVTWTLSRGRNSVATTVSFVRSVPPTIINATYLNFAVEGLRKVDKRFEVGLGARGAWQDDAYTGAFYAVGFYVALVWHEPRIRL
jgi:hypothetical protein